MEKEAEISKMPKAPLQEVIFEVRWELDISPDTKLPYDSGFNTAIGLLLANVKKEFPVFKEKIPNELQIPANFLDYQTIYQYWSGEDTWPVLQLGPGIFTINETEKNYQWRNHFFPLIKKSLILLNSSYNKELKYIYSCLRYIDRISVNDYNFINWQGFIRENLNFNIETKFNTRGNLKKFSFNQVFESNDGSDIQITISNGKNKKLEDILVWEIAIMNFSPADYTNLLKWLDNSHKTTHQLFKEICKDELYDSFK